MERLAGSSRIRDNPATRPKFSWTSQVICNGYVQMWDVKILYYYSKLQRFQNTKNISKPVCFIKKSVNVFCPAVTAAISWA